MRRLADDGFHKSPRIRRRGGTPRPTKTLRTTCGAVRSAPAATTERTALSKRGYRGNVKPMRLSLALEAVTEGYCFEFHADGVHHRNDGAGFEYETWEG